jgi:hypothetical protein
MSEIRILIAEDHETVREGLRLIIDTQDDMQVFYYLKLLFGVMLGIRHTSNPLNLKWRWDFWQYKYSTRRQRFFK